LALGFKRLNYVLTVWDLCHRDQPEFPEVRDAQQFEAREWFYRHSLARALVVLTDSQLLSQRLRERYGADEDRLLAMPFAPSPLLSTTRCDAGAVLTKYEIQPGFFFYPAQFWSHKNHVRLLQAVAQLKAKGVEARLVFAGGDKGNRAHVERVCARLGLVRQVQFLGFVPAEHMSALYSSCLAVVMPTYFGPTNLPPLEAWAHDKPLVYSRHLAAQAGSAALLVDPDSAEDVAAALLQLLEPDRAAHWIEQGRIRLAALNDERERAEARFAQRLEQFALRRECWESQ
jgi:glycosyltransferase involved in cell wall biosynthesis